MKKIITIFLFIGHAMINGIHAQQIKSPLELSFKTYQEMKKDTRYSLNWISLGPMVISVGAVNVQVG